MEEAGGDDPNISSILRAIKWQPPKRREIGTFNNRQTNVGGAIVVPVVTVTNEELAQARSAIGLTPLPPPQITIKDEGMKDEAEPEKSGIPDETGETGGRDDAAEKEPTRGPDELSREKGIWSVIKGC